MNAMTNPIGSLRMRAAALGLTAIAVLGTAPASNAAEHARTDGTVRSFDGTSIAYTLFQPAGSSASAPVPLVLHSHGWGGSRTKTGFGAWLDAGFGVLSFDQRGFGESGGKANVQDPQYEGRDVDAVVDLVSSLPWVAKEARFSRRFGSADPWLFAIGGSYGGAYQTIGALTELRTVGATRFDALAPEITWYDLPASLGPKRVVRSVWVSALFAAGVSRVPTYVHEGYAVGVATGWLPDGTVPGTTDLVAEFAEHSPRAFADAGIRLDLPVLFGQGVTDNLFNLNQGLHNFQRVLTPRAKARSLFVGYNGGHVLPEVLPAGPPISGDPCSGAGGFEALSRRFFSAVYAGTDPSVLLPERFNIASQVPGVCVRTDDPWLRGERAIALPVVSLAAPAGPPVHVEIAEGPLTVAGIAKLTGNLTTLGVDARAFFGLSVGTTPAEARLVANNVMPVRRVLPVSEQPLYLELPGSAIVVPEGQRLYLTVSPVSGIFAGFGSRTPGAVLLEDARVRLPIVSNP